MTDLAVRGGATVQLTVPGFAIFLTISGNSEATRKMLRFSGGTGLSSNMVDLKL